ncbi:phage integrase N-terminal SAM-like domain-containing protein, partial [Desulfatirhabdium butyrativorans]|uniref:phage integrase N-terminal SAM-like domain-containing protein n=1 Tax=Desulfatirhabdium butyrativorans TaxID=340467 RepID=UPI001B7F934F
MISLLRVFHNHKKRRDIMSHTLQTPWYTKTINVLQLAGKGDKTQESYARSVRQLLEYINKDPLQITEQELKDY